VPIRIPAGNGTLEGWGWLFGGLAALFLLIVVLRQQQVNRSHARQLLHAEEYFANEQRFAYGQQVADYPDESADTFDPPAIPQQPAKPFFLDELPPPEEPVLAIAAVPQTGVPPLITAENRPTVVHGETEFRQERQPVVAVALPPSDVAVKWGGVIVTAFAVGFALGTRNR
jgi:hypothetical protein